MKKIFAVILISFIACNTLYSQSTAPKGHKTFMDKVADIFELRRAFDTQAETKKPAQLSYKKNENEDAVYKVDMAILYKGLDFGNYGVTPAIEFEYSSNVKDKQQKLEGGLIGYINVLHFNPGYLIIEPSVTFTKDFITKKETLDGKLYVSPRFPAFFIPIRNVSSIKFNYNNESDNRWVFGFNPVFGLEYRKIVSQKGPNDVEMFNVMAGEMTLKRFYLEFDIHGRYEKELEKTKSYIYKYGAGMTFYFDENERASFNMKYDREEKFKVKNYQFSMGLGVKI